MIKGTNSSNDVWNYFRIVLFHALIEMKIREEEVGLDELGRREGNKTKGDQIIIGNILQQKLMRS